MLLYISFFKKIVTYKCYENVLNMKMKLIAITFVILKNLLVFVLFMLAVCVFVRV